MKNKKKKVKETTKKEPYIQIPIRYILETPNDMELGCLVRNIASNY